MTCPTRLFIACSPHPRVGVTTTARLFTDYFISSHIPVEGFDTDPHEPAYAELFPRQAHVIDISEIKGQISLFDRLLVDDGVPKVIDVWRRSYERFFATVKEIGFFEEARGRNVEPVLLFHADEQPATLAAAQALAAAWPEAPLFVVSNEGAAPLGREAPDILARYPASGKFVIPALETPVQRALEDPHLSLTGFLQAPPGDMSLVVRAALKSWIAPIFTQLRSQELRRELGSSDLLR
jgi:hypothetical protein